ncbi:ADP-dependent glucokinase-like [Rhinatrema bivittatum]|uniref:ADP-dependent glucokinase-like n=1 Tax=Rhinatrema bivittatum TaxID=194408 RepID=UPI00112DFED8|nr:ADP-dependent glucokinase-like [Rhinatrema bivittatum]
MAAPRLLCGSALSFLALLLAYWYRQAGEESLRERLDTVLSSLLRAEGKVDVDVALPPRVAIGFGGCLDIIVDGVALLNEAGIEPSSTPIHHNFIETEQQLAESFTYFFLPGAASERYVSNETLFRMLVGASRRLPEMRWSLGGNAPVMANRLAREGCSVLLGGRLSTDQMNVLAEHITVAGEPVDDADIHLILEYPTGARWGDYIAGRANRYIVHSDDHNPMIDSLEDFASQLHSFKPALLIIGGLQMMDSFPFEAGQREARLQSLQNLMMSIDRSTGTHFEMASFVEESLMKDLLHYLVPYSDSLGMNEQELPNLLSLFKGGNITVLSDPYPRVASILDQMRELYQLINSQELKEGQRRLTRLHIHTLAFQAIIVAKGSVWKNTMSATAKASLTANRHVCGSMQIDTSKAKLIMDDSFSISRELGSQRISFKESSPVSCWEENNYEICIAPVLVCTEVFQTAGGGDNISAAGLVLQI